ncbi:MAG: YggT family protein [Alphaproteobacteria bacterium]|jgi:YggT family protein|uniref:YggT family protein n=1 Tax=Phenylobacterium sp. TaxID=1871053 RepID=UPI0025EDAB27|nr:YggT family protein [Phenylobacterium sp.]MCA6346979.1 YggT family protein [Phenylobacterium sp.]MCA6352733.1 YggT family protein [Phenylobacterium sp.]MCA6355612.1 YggT family protein [Phenylobacterium sp.]MCA6357731.1 YggT family protein [Phenylobacterium sp.]MCA6360446.1 YggT family protein [Phenylobacterium sp.]
MIGSFLHFVLSGLLEVMVWAIIISAIMSWLVAFNVLNLRNNFVASIHRVLETLTAPILAPLQRFIPPIAGLDITPIIAILVLQGIQRFILPGLLGGL